jgi:DNA-directed RNA polymerase subunit RPC12/RpoP
VKQTCSNCGAQSIIVQKNPQPICQFCGSTFEINGVSADSKEESDPGIGYQPDPPPPYKEFKDEVEKPADSEKTPPVIKDPVVDIPPEVVSTIVNSGRKIPRYVFLALVLLIALCSACFIFSSYLN